MAVCSCLCRTCMSGLSFSFAVEDTIWSASSNLVLIARSVTARSVKYLQRWLAIPVVIYPGAALPPGKSLSLEEESTRSKFSEYLIEILWSGGRLRIDIPPWRCNLNGSPPSPICVYAAVAEHDFSHTTRHASTPRQEPAGAEQSSG